jgi:periplasmic protein TonB
MSDSTAAVAAPEPDGPLHVRADRPIDVHFSFEQRQSRVGAVASVMAHVVLLVLAVVVARYRPEPRIYESPPELKTDRLVFLAVPGPGGGGGGGGNKMKEPPRVAELPGKDKITVPVEKKPDLTPPPKVEEPETPPLEALNIPVMNMAAAAQMLPGTIQSGNVASESQGSGSGGGAGTGSGTGVGSGQGSGLGEGRGGGTGGL